MSSAVSNVPKPSPRRVPAPATPAANLTVMSEYKSAQVPGWVTNLDAFRRRVRSAEYPDDVPIFFLAGEIWVDLSMEDFFTHNQVKNEIGFVLTGLSKTHCPGRFVPDGMLVTNVKANLSCEPDGMFVSRESFDSGRVRLVPGQTGKRIELEGTPDMVLQVVSDSSHAKDTQQLRDLFWKAGIPEYWLVDARGDDVVFDIWRHSAKGYVATRRQGGWLKSAVFRKPFRLNRSQDERGDPEYTLEMK
jgi:Uma2 family endonuclease